MGSSFLATVFRCKDCRVLCKSTSTCPDTRSAVLGDSTPKIPTCLPTLNPTLTDSGGSSGGGHGSVYWRTYEAGETSPNSPLSSSLPRGKQCFF